MHIVPLTASRPQAQELSCIASFAASKGRSWRGDNPLGADQLAGDLMDVSGVYQWNIFLYMLYHAHDE